MNRLWAGWRMAYIQKASKPGAARREPCLFCKQAKARPSAKSLVLAASPLAVVMMNLYPYNVGHVLIAPRKHRANLADLTPEETLDLGVWLARMERALRREYRPHGLVDLYPDPEAFIGPDRRRQP